MSKTEMPAVEASSYELAFHVLPTIAEGEVTTIFQSVKDLITKNGGEITIEESPARFDLAYEITKYLEGRNRKFSSAYFGWVRFTMEPSMVDEIGEETEANASILRHLLTKLTKVEEENPFYFHEALEEENVENIEVDKKTEVKAKKEVKKEEVKTEEKAEESEEEVKAEVTEDKA
jgi:ribosomal protein S6